MRSTCEGGIGAAAQLVEPQRDDPGDIGRKRLV
jgi:hypothetical protein